MLKYLPLALCLLAPPAMAQAQNSAAMGTVLLGCVGREVQAAERIAQLEAEIAKLKAVPAPPEDKKP